MTGSLKQRWRAEMLTTQAVSDGCRVLLLVLAESMAEDGTVSVSRTTLAKAIGRSPVRVTERIGEAVATGWLSRVAAGQPGRTAVYRALRGPQQLGTDARTKRDRNRLHMVRTPVPPQLGTGVPTGQGYARPYQGPRGSLVRAGVSPIEPGSEATTTVPSRCDVGRDAPEVRQDEERQRQAPHPLCEATS